MKQIINMLRLDMKLIFRDKIAVYIIIIPMVMAFVILTALKSAEDDNIRIAAADNIPGSVMNRLNYYTDIETAGDINALKNRVNEFDNIPGVYWDGAVLQVFFQGNEGAVYEESVRSAIDSALSTSLKPMKVIDTSSGRDIMTQMIIAVLLTAPAAIGGIVGGLNIITEKETAVNKAYRITPMTIKNFFISRYIVSVAVGLINLTGISIILGAAAKLPAILLATVFALPLFAFALMLIGGTAKDKMGGLSMIKVIMLVFLCLPIAVAITPDSFRFFYYPFPMYWHFRSMESALQGSFSLRYGIITFIVSGAVFALSSLTFGKKLIKN